MDTQIYGGYDGYLGKIPAFSLERLDYMWENEWSAIWWGDYDYPLNFKVGSLDTDNLKVAVMWGSMVLTTQKLKKVNAALWYDHLGNPSAARDYIVPDGELAWKAPPGAHVHYALIINDVLDQNDVMISGQVYPFTNHGADQFPTGNARSVLDLASGIFAVPFSVPFDWAHHGKVKGTDPFPTLSGGNFSRQHQGVAEVPILEIGPEYYSVPEKGSLVIPFLWAGNELAPYSFKIVNNKAPLMTFSTDKPHLGAATVVVAPKGKGSYAVKFTATPEAKVGDVITIGLTNPYNGNQGSQFGVSAYWEHVVIIVAADAVPTKVPPDPEPIPEGSFVISGPTIAAENELTTFKIEVAKAGQVMPEDITFEVTISEDSDQTSQVLSTFTQVTANKTFTVTPTTYDKYPGHGGFIRIAVGISVNKGPVSQIHKTLAIQKQAPIEPKVSFVDKMDAVTSQVCQITNPQKDTTYTAGDAIGIDVAVSGTSVTLTAPSVTSSNYGNFSVVATRGTDKIYSPTYSVLIEKVELQIPELATELLVYEENKIVKLEIIPGPKNPKYEVTIGDSVSGSVSIENNKTITWVMPGDLRGDELTRDCRMVIRGSLDGYDDCQKTFQVTCNQSEEPFCIEPIISSTEETLKGREITELEITNPEDGVAYEWVCKIHGGVSVDSDNVLKAKFQASDTMVDVEATIQVIASKLDHKDKIGEIKIPITHTPLPIPIVSTLAEVNEGATIGIALDNYAEFASIENLTYEMSFVRKAGSEAPLGVAVGVPIIIENSTGTLMVQDWEAPWVDDHTDYDIKCVVSRGTGAETFSTENTVVPSIKVLALTADVAVFEDYATCTYGGSISLTLKNPNPKQTYTIVARPLEATAGIISGDFKDGNTTIVVTMPEFDTHTLPVAGVFTFQVDATRDQYTPARSQVVLNVVKPSIIPPVIVPGGDQPIPSTGSTMIPVGFSFAYYPATQSHQGYLGDGGVYNQRTSLAMETLTTNDVADMATWPTLTWVDENTGIEIDPTDRLACYPLTHPAVFGHEEYGMDPGEYDGDGNVIRPATPSLLLDSIGDNGFPNGFLFVEVIGALGVVRVMARDAFFIHEEARRGFIHILGTIGDSSVNWFPDIWNNFQLLSEHGTTQTTNVHNVSYSQVVDTDNPNRVVVKSAEHLTGEALMKMVIAVSEDKEIVGQVIDMGYQSTNALQLKGGLSVLRSKAQKNEEQSSTFEMETKSGTKFQISIVEDPENSDNASLVMTKI